LQSVVFAVAYKKCDLKITEVVASGTKQKTAAFYWLLNLFQYL
jgi:hypothetical protein